MHVLRLDTLPLRVASRIRIQDLATSAYFSSWAAVLCSNQLSYVTSGDDRTRTGDPNNLMLLLWIRNWPASMFKAHFQALHPADCSRPCEQGLTYVNLLF